MFTYKDWAENEWKNCQCPRKNIEKPSESWTAVAQDNVKKLQEKSDSLRTKCKKWVMAQVFYPPPVMKSLNSATIACSLAF